MGEDEYEQPLTEHLVDQFASYFLITMVAFHLVGYIPRFAFADTPMAQAEQSRVGQSA